jgi:hypothetical protein
MLNIFGQLTLPILFAVWIVAIALVLILRKLAVMSEPSSKKLLGAILAVGGVVCAIILFLFLVGIFAGSTTVPSS